MSEMHDDRPFFASRERLDEAALLSSQLQRGSLSVGYYSRRRPGLGITDPNPPIPVFMAVVAMAPLPSHFGWQNGRQIVVPHRETGGLACVDLREPALTELHVPFRTLNIFCGLASFDELTEELHQPSIERLSCPRTEPVHDEYMFRLSWPLMHLISRPEEASALMGDHLMAVIRLHLATRYGGLVVDRDAPQPGLAPWQIRRATELLAERLDTDIDIAGVAATCGLSSRQFQRAFKRSLGMAPHRWQIEQRLERARGLIRCREQTLSEIAQSCGFADQSHLGRLFKRRYGVSPAAYRRLARC